MLDQELQRQHCRYTEGRIVPPAFICPPPPAIDGLEKHTPKRCANIHLPIFAGACKLQALRGLPQSRFSNRFFPSRVFTGTLVATLSMKNADLAHVCPKVNSVESSGTYSQEGVNPTGRILPQTAANDKKSTARPNAEQTRHGQRGARQVALHKRKPCLDL